jgi:hypothetical protein
MLTSSFQNFNRSIILHIYTYFKLVVKIENSTLLFLESEPNLSMAQITYTDKGPTSPTQCTAFAPDASSTVELFVIDNPPSVFL